VSEPPGEQDVPRADDAEEWGTGDWQQQVEPPPAPWPTVTPAYLAVLALGASGLALLGAVGQGWVSAGLFRAGAVLVAVAVAVAALLRAVLPVRHAGMLALRSRRVDVALYAALGAAALVLAALVPPPTG
jgi:hypothetical protein